MPLGIDFVIPRRLSPRLFTFCPWASSSSSLNVHHPSFSHLARHYFALKTFQNLTAVNPRRTTAKLSTFCPLASYFHGKHLETHSIALDFAKLNFNQSYIFKVNKPLVAPQPSYPHSALWHRIFAVKPLETHSIALDFAKLNFRVNKPLFTILNHLINNESYEGIIHFFSI